MKFAVDKQTPVSALMTLMVIAAAAYTRYGLAPYAEETVRAGVMPPLAEVLSSFGAAHPWLGLAAALVMTVAAGMVIGQTGGRFRLYPTQTFISMPVYGIVACGIFISGDAVSAAASSLFTAMMLRYLCRGYLCERDLSAMLYAGLSVGMLILTSTAGLFCAAAALSAVFILSFSARELFVMLIAILLPVAACCFAVWALGGEFLAPVMTIWDSLFADSGVDTFGNDAVGALLLCGVVAFTFVCSSVLFLANRFMVSVKSRGIFIFVLVLAALLLVRFALPSSTPSDFGIAAVPLSMIMPVIFIREDERLSVIIYVSLWVLFIVHMFFY